VIKEVIRERHRGQQPYGTAWTDWTHECRRSTKIN